MNILPEIYLLLALSALKFIPIFKNKINNPLLFIFLGFEVVALIPSLVLYSNGILIDPSYINYTASSENIRRYLLTYLALQGCIIFFTNRRFIALLNNLLDRPIKFSFRNIVILNIFMITSSVFYLSGTSVAIVFAISLNTYIGLLQARIAVSLISSNMHKIASIIFLVFSGPAYTYVWYSLGFVEDLSRLALVWPFLIYLILGWSISKLNKMWIVVFLTIFLVRNTIDTIVGGGDYLVVKHGINVVAAIGDKEIQKEPGHLFYNTGYQFFAPTLGLGVKNYTANAIYQRHFYQRSEQQISSSWGIGITLPANLILSFGFTGSLSAIIFLSLLYRRFLKSIWGVDILNSPWSVPLHLYIALRIFAALRMDMSYLTSTLIFDILTISLLFSKLPRFIR